MTHTLHGALLALVFAGTCASLVQAEPAAAVTNADALPAGAVKLWELTPAQAADPTIAAAREAIEKRAKPYYANPPRYLFVPETPCTIFDTRYATNPDSAGFVSDGVTKRFNAINGNANFTAQGGSVCQTLWVPLNSSSPEAVLMTVYVSDMTANGWVTFYPANIPDPSQSTISVYYAPGPTRTQTVASAIAIYPYSDYQIAVTARYGGANVSASVVGYFIRMPQQVILCAAGTPVTTALSTSGDSTFSVASSACTGTMVSVSCSASGDASHVSFTNIDMGTGTCAGTHTGTLAASVTATPRCCRVPGDNYFPQ